MGQIQFLAVCTVSLTFIRVKSSELTILVQDGQALLNEKTGVEDNQAEAERENVVAGADLEEGSNALLHRRKPDQLPQVPQRWNVELLPGLDAGHDPQRPPALEEVEALLETALAAVANMMKAARIPRDPQARRED